MEKKLYVELSEEYNKEGVCVKRSINGQDIPHDKHPSVVFMGEDIKSANCIKTKKYMTPMQANKVYGYKLKD